MGKYCHLCLEHDYTTAFSECQGLSEKIFKCALHKHFIRTHCMPDEGTLEIRLSKPLWGSNRERRQGRISSPAFFFAYCISFFEL